MNRHERRYIQSFICSSAHRRCQGLFPHSRLSGETHERSITSHRTLVPRAALLLSRQILSATCFKSKQSGAWHFTLARDTGQGTRTMSQFAIPYLWKGCWVGDTIDLQSTEPFSCPAYPTNPTHSSFDSLPSTKLFHRPIRHPPSAYSSPHNKLDSIARKSCPSRNPDPHMEIPRPGPSYATYYQDPKKIASNNGRHVLLGTRVRRLKRWEKMGWLGRLVDCGRSVEIKVLLPLCRFNYGGIAGAGQIGHLHTWKEKRKVGIVLGKRRPSNTLFPTVVYRRGRFGRGEGR